MELEILGRAALATLLAGMIGWDRERQARPAGLRTHMLVGLTSALFVGISEVVLHDHRDDKLAMDPLRVLEAVAVAAGVSFLGAGTVFFSRGRSVQGLTTAASLWTAGAVGVAAGLGRPLLATGSTLLALLILMSAHLTSGIESQRASPESEPEPAEGQGTKS